MNKQIFIIINTFLLVHATHYAQDAIQLHNMTDKNLSFAFYYTIVTKPTIERASEINVIQAGSTMSAERPKYKLGYDVLLVMDENKAPLVSTISKKDLNKMSYGSVGILLGKSFYIATKNQKFKIYDETKWRVLKPTREALRPAKEWVVKVFKDMKGVALTSISDVVKKTLKSTNVAYREYPFASTVATVRVGNQLPEGEKSAMQVRLTRIKETIENKFNLKINRAPKISFIASGGGYRAMCVMLGFFTAAQQAGLFDMVTWIAALSGGSWGTGVYLAMAQEYQKRTGKKLSPSECRNILYGLIDKKSLKLHTKEELSLFNDNILTRALTEQPATIVSIYGVLLGNRLLAYFGDRRHRIYLWELADFVKNGSWPLPIFTTVRGESLTKVAQTDTIKKEELPWFEFTPWEVGGAWLNMYVPTWAFGRKFEQGKSVDFELPKTLGSTLGMAGSAFGALVEDIIQELPLKIENKIVKDIIDTILKDLILPKLGDKRLAWAEVYNFSKGVAQSPVKDLDTLRMVDAGLSFNLPYPPVSGERPERTSDILIFLDASKEVKGAEALKYSEEYARRKNLKFPKINYENIENKIMSIFKDEKDPEVPVVIYMPRINDQSLWNKFKEPEYKHLEKYVRNFDIEKCTQAEFCETFNLTYTKEQAQQLSALAEFNMLVAVQGIFEEIKQLIKRKGLALAE